MIGSQPIAFRRLAFQRGGEMKVRLYEPGDENLIEPNEYALDWADEEFETVKKFNEGFTYTCLNDAGKIQAIGNLHRIDDDPAVFFCWFMEDVNANPLFLIEFNKILKKYLQNNFVLCTLSKEGPMQDKLHKYLGFEKVRKMGDAWIWVRQRKQ